jgi:hypothetical protein
LGKAAKAIDIYRWFCGLSIEDKIPDQSAFSRPRHERFSDSDMFRRVFEHVVETCIVLTLTDQKFLSFALSSLWKLIPGLAGLSFQDELSFAGRERSAANTAWSELFSCSKK